VVWAVTDHHGKILEQDNQEQQTEVLAAEQVPQAVVLVDLTVPLADQAAQVSLLCVT
jgi:hypothetical protein